VKVHRIQDSGFRIQKAEGRRQKAEGRRQKAEGRRQISLPDFALVPGLSFVRINPPLRRAQ
jgi:hypothetical protein